METKDHLGLAIHFANKKEYSISTISIVSFVLGNIMPDINLFTYISGHTYDGTSEKIQRVFRELQKKSRLKVRDFYEFGKAMHYLVDYFTFPHTNRFQGSLKEHCNYEQVLHHQFWKSFKHLSEDKSRLFARISQNSWKRNTDKKRKEATVLIKNKLVEYKESFMKKQKEKASTLETFNIVQCIHEEYLNNRRNMEDDCYYIRQIYEMVFHKIYNNKNVKETIGYPCPTY